MSNRIFSIEKLGVKNYFNKVIILVITFSFFTTLVHADEVALCGAKEALRPMAEFNAGRAATVLLSGELASEMGYQKVSEEVFDVPVGVNTFTEGVPGMADQLEPSEMAAINVFDKGLIGSGDKVGIDTAGTEAFMRGYRLLAKRGGIETRIVSGEGHWDDLSGTPAMIEKGTIFGKGRGNVNYIMVDPVDGTTWTAQGKVTASTHVAVARDEAFRSLPDIHYGLHLVFYSDDVVDINMNGSVKDQLGAIAKANGLKVEDLEVYIRDFPVNEPIIRAAKEAGAKVIAKTWGGASPMVWYGLDKHTVFMGTNGMVEARLAAAALKNFQKKDGSGAQMVSLMIANKGGKNDGNSGDRNKFVEEELAMLREGVASGEITEDELQMIVSCKKQWRITDFVNGPAVFWATMITDDIFYVVPGLERIPGVRKDTASGLYTVHTVRVGPDGIKLIKRTYSKLDMSAPAGPTKLQFLQNKKTRDV